MGLNDTPRANRIHIGIFGRTNSGKSSLINALTGQEAARLLGVAPSTFYRWLRQEGETK